VCLSIFSSLEALLIGLIGCTLGLLYENFNRALPPVLVVLASAVLIPLVYKALSGLKKSLSAPTVSNQREVVP
jgi:hypothetical protein